TRLLATFVRDPGWTRPTRIKCKHMGRARHEREQCRVHNGRGWRLANELEYQRMRVERNAKLARRISRGPERLPSDVHERTLADGLATRLLRQRRRRDLSMARPVFAGVRGACHGRRLAPAARPLGANWAQGG